MHPKPQVAGAIALILILQLISPTFGQSTQPLIDWDRARQLYQRERNGQLLSPEDRDYLQRAKAERQNQNRARTPASPPRESTGLVPLCDMTAKSQNYKGEPGGLYGDGRNAPPPELAKLAAVASAKVQPLDTDGHPSPTGKIVLLSVGMSNTTQEFSRFKQIADRDPAKSSRVLIIDAAQGGKDSRAWLQDNNVWKVADHLIAAAGATPNQIQVVWLKQARINQAGIGEFPLHAKALQSDINAIIHRLHETFPNLKLVFLSSRIYAGYATTPLNPEPYAYESAFAVRWAIEEQMKNRKPDDPVVLWGPYLWSDGIKGRKLDDLIYSRDNLGPDGTHPSNSGRDKVAQLLLQFFKTDPAARDWFIGLGQPK